MIIDECRDCVISMSLYLNMDDEKHNFMKYEVFKNKKIKGRYSDFFTAYYEYQSLSKM